jgi:hypothetical protein
LSPSHPGNAGPGTSSPTYRSQRASLSVADLPLLVPRLGRLDSRAGYALVLAGRDCLADGDRAGRSLLRRGTALLRAGAHDLPPGEPSQRRALYEGAWLALGYAARGDLEGACGEARTAIGRLCSVRSPRSNTLLHRLSADLRRRTRNPHVASLLPDLDQALATQPQAPGIS